MVYIEDKDLITFFLRTVMIDPRERIIFEVRDIQNITDETIVSVSSSNKISHISALSIDGNSLTAFVDYLYDIKNRKIIFFEEQTGELAFDIYSGINWIQPSRTREEKLGKDNFPWIIISVISAPKTALGNFDACKIINNRMQVDVWTKKDYIGTINPGDYERRLAGDKLAMYLGKQVEDNLDNNAFDLTAKHFRDYIPIEGHKLNDFNTDYNLDDCMYEFFIKSIIKPVEVPII